MADTERVEKAFSFMMTLGISNEEVEPVLTKLLKVYEGNWELIEDENYQTLVDAYFDREKDKVGEGERKATASCYVEEKPTGEPPLVDGEVHDLSTMDSASKMLCAEDTKISSKNFEQKIRKPSRTFTEDIKPKTSSEASHSTLSKGKKIPILVSARDRESYPEKASSAGRCGQFEKDLVKPRIKKPKLLTSTNHNEGNLCVKPQSTLDQDMQSKNVVPACSNNARAHHGNIMIASSSRLGEVKMSLNCDSALGRQNFSMPNLDVVMKFMDRKYRISCHTVGSQFSTAELLNDLCRSFLKLGLRKGSNSNQANSHSQQYVNQGERKPFNFISDITKGTEKLKISLIDEFGSDDLPKFNYVPNSIIYQSAILSISLARISDEGCCADCSGDCLSSSLPCACAQETGGEYAYTPQGLLKEEFLTACVTLKNEPQVHHYVYCQECPLEKSKNEYMPERCKGHMVRKFIKECWRKCGCDMLCGNRIVQRGITCKLQVFLTREGKGWGLRSLEDLPKGTFVCEYVGEILTNMELYDRIMHKSGNDRHTYPVTLDADWGSEKGLKDEEALCLDATYNGNVGRFINHRCYDANLIDIPVEIESPDHHFYHLAFFTNRKVSAYEELTWDYGIDFDDDDHPIKAFRCSCGSAFCSDKKKKGILSLTFKMPKNLFRAIRNKAASGNAERPPEATLNPVVVLDAPSPPHPSKGKGIAVAVEVSRPPKRARDEAIGAEAFPASSALLISSQLKVGQGLNFTILDDYQELLRQSPAAERLSSCLELHFRALALNLYALEDSARLEKEQAALGERLVKCEKELFESNDTNSQLLAKMDEAAAEKEKMAFQMVALKEELQLLEKRRLDEAWAARVELEKARAKVVDQAKEIKTLEAGVISEHTLGFEKAVRQAVYFSSLGDPILAERFDVNYDIHMGKWTSIDDMPEDEDSPDAAKDPQDPKPAENVVAEDTIDV